MPGQYRLAESQPAGLMSVACGPRHGRRLGVRIDRVARCVDQTSTFRWVTLSAIHYDFAEAQPASLSGFIYRDDDNDGVREPGETGIAGVRVQLVPINTIAPQSVLTVTTCRRRLLFVHGTGTRQL